MIVDFSVVATDAIAVTPNDTTVLAPTLGLWIGGAGSGNLTVVTAQGRTVAFAGIAAGTFIPIEVTEVSDTGTDVTSIVAFY
jgi:hypothetical protein